MTENIELRLSQHNLGQNTSTKAYVPWMLIYKEQFETRIEARIKEKKFKTSSRRRFIRKNYLLNN